MSKVFLMVVVAALGLAQIVPSCGGSDEEHTIVGWVARKFPAPGLNRLIIVINNVEYDVPPEFYAEVKVGDLVKFEGGLWKIVKRAGSG